MRRTSFKHLLTRKIARAIGLSSLIIPTMYACGGTVTNEPSGGTGGTGGAGTSTAEATTDTTTVASSTTGSTMQTSTVGPASSSSGGPECTETSTQASSGGGPNIFHYTVCLDNQNIPCPVDTMAATDAINNLLGKECCIDSLSCEYLTEVVCGPYASADDQCCFEIMTQDDGCAIPGRPYLVGDHAVMAPSQPRRDWGDSSLSLDGLTQEARQVLAQQWTAHALAEHASVASFAQFALELMALAAPAELVADASQAAVEEVQHARLAFELASAFGGEAMGPGPLPMATLRTPTLTQLAVATVKEGCINETLSTLLLAEQLEQASHPGVRKALATMVADETRHAELAWRTVAWAIREGGAEVHAAVKDAFAEATAPAALAHGLTGEALAASPSPTPAVAQRILRDGLTTLIQPCAEALLTEATTDALATDTPTAAKPTTAAAC